LGPNTDVWMPTPLTIIQVEGRDSKPRDGGSISDVSRLAWAFASVKHRNLWKVTDVEFVVNGGVECFVLENNGNSAVANMPTLGRSHSNGKGLQKLCGALSLPGPCRSLPVPS
jgi:hypothetical protein